MRNEYVLVMMWGHVMSWRYVPTDDDSRDTDDEDRTPERYSMVGTPYYMSPEVIDRCTYGKAVDYWAYGVLIFECSTGKDEGGGLARGFIL